MSPHLGLKASGSLARSMAGEAALLVGSGWHASIFRAESAALFADSEALHRRLVAVMDPDPDRCAASATVDEALFPMASLEWSGDGRALANVIADWCREHLAPNGRSIAVRASTLDSAPAGWHGGELQRSVGAALVEAGWRIDLDAPDVTLRIISGGPQEGPTNPDHAAPHHPGHLIVWGVRIFESDADWQARAAPRRPFFKPVSLDVRLARAMLNLAHPRPPSQRLGFVDPFCGTGGLLLEAALLGIEALGLDLDPEMVTGCERNLEWLLDQPEAGHIDSSTAVHLLCADALTAGLPAAVPAFAFDPPYGRNSWRSDESLALFIGALERCRHNATSDARLVTLLPWPPEHIEALRRGETLPPSSLNCLGIGWPGLQAMIRGTGWVILDAIPISIHASLSRLLLVCCLSHPDA